MAQIPETATFDVIADQLKFTTQTNGDILIINGINLDYDQAASLAWLVNHTTDILEVRVRIKP